MESDQVTRLRLYALDLHMFGGFNKYSAAMSDAADTIESRDKLIDDICKMFLDLESRLPNNLIVKEVKSLYKKSS